MRGSGTPVAADATNRKFIGTWLATNSLSWSMSHVGPAFSVIVVPTVPGGTASGCPEMETEADGVGGGTGEAVPEGVARGEGSGAADAEPLSPVSDSTTPSMTPRTTRRQQHTQRNRARRRFFFFSFSGATSRWGPHTSTDADSIDAGAASVLEKSVFVIESSKFVGSPAGSDRNAVRSGESTTVADGLGEGDFMAGASRYGGRGGGGGHAWGKGAALGGRRASAPETRDHAQCGEWQRTGGVMTPGPRKQTGTGT